MLRFFTHFLFLFLLSLNIKRYRQKYEWKEEKMVHIKLNTDFHREIFLRIVAINENKNHLQIIAII